MKAEDLFKWNFDPPPHLGATFQSTRLWGCAIKQVPINSSVACLLPQCLRALGLRPALGQGPE